MDGVNLSDQDREESGLGREGALHHEGFPASRLSRQLRLTLSRRGSFSVEFMVKASGWRTAQIAAPLIPIPIGCFLLYKALTSMMRSPPPRDRSPAQTLASPVYPEPVYQRMSFTPAAFIQNTTPRPR